MLNLKFKWLFLIASFALISCDPSTDPDPDMDTDSYESYRYELWKLLNGKGYDVDFVGTQFDDGTYDLVNGVSFDPDHEGIGGLEADGLLANLDQVLPNIDKPDIILLCIGGNDLLAEEPVQGVIDTIALILERINQFDEDIVVFIEQIAPGNNELMTDEFQAVISEFNEKIAVLASSWVGSQNIYSVDMYTDFTEDLLADDVHYNELGAVEIAARYGDAIGLVFAPGTYKLLPLGDSRVEGAHP
jgi:lysophospholipase L1-like esterase